jgi:serine/threonine protein kinase
MTTTEDSDPTRSERSELSWSFRDGAISDDDYFKPHPQSTPPPNGSPSLLNKKIQKATISPKIQSKHLRSNLTRAHGDRDPLFYYEMVTTLGVGSMGSVAKVRKRGTVVGGSARKGFAEAVTKQKREKECIRIPWIGGIFRLCFEGKLKIGAETEKTNILSSIKRGFSFVESGGSASIEESIETSSSGSKQNIYAMKSIHLTRVTDGAFRLELKNEIDILRKLDHPHIVRAIETL